jgi:hypothetical protein
MTVEELIILLQSMPQDMEVYVNGDTIVNVKIVEDYPLGDYANPNCKHEDVVIIE